MADIFTLESSSTSQSSETEPYINKSWVNIPDINNGSYASNIVSFDCSSLYNSQKFVNPQEIYVAIPIVMVLNSSNGFSAGAKPSPYSLGLKNGIYNLISSCAVQYDNGQVQQVVSNANVYVSFKMLSSLSPSDLKVDAASLMFSQDTNTSWNYSNTPSLYGIGSSNNNNIPSTPTLASYSGESYNSGLLNRQYRSSYDPTSTTITTTAFTQNTLKPYFTYTNGNNYCAWYMVATIKLGDISDFFNKAPLCRGFYSRIDLSMNMGSFRTTVNCVGTAPAVPTAAAPGPNFFTNYALASFGQSPSDINFQNGCNPLILTQAFKNALGNVPASVWNTTTAAPSPVGSLNFEIICGIYIARVTSSVPGQLGALNQSQLSVSPHTMSSCVLYAPLIEMRPEYSLKYLQENRNKLIVYENINAQPYTNIPYGSAFSYNITTGLSDIVGILCVPFVSATSNGVAAGAVAGTIGFSPMVSPFASEPATTSPCLALTNFNIQIAGMNVLQRNVLYDYEMFLQELYGQGSINGSLTRGLKSGLIDEQAFNNIYRYYYVNLERHIDDSSVKKSITMSGTNSSSVNIDIMTFIITKSKLIIDIETGKVVGTNQF